jgi:ADP-ribose 1''-phosphate phosphatase
VGLTKATIDLFDSPAGGYLVHSCNGLGVWGAGIAAGFRERFPDSHRVYKQRCLFEPWAVLAGRALVLPEENGHRVVCLMVSERPGLPQDLALARSLQQKALSRLIDWLPIGASVSSNRFGSGIFGLDWDVTEARLVSTLLTRPDLSWTVCAPA